MVDSQSHQQENIQSIKHTTASWWQNDQRWIEIIDASDRGIAITDRAGCIAVWSKGMEHITGVSASQLIGVPIWDVHERLWAPELRTSENIALLAPFYQNILKVGKSLDATASTSIGKLIRLDGQSYFVEYDLFTQPEDDGFIIITIFRDITARMNEQNMNVVRGMALEAAANSVVITDPQGTILWVNPAFTRVTGYTLAEAVGNNPSILKSGYQDDSFYKQMWADISSGKPWKGQLTNRRKDGSLYTEEMTITPVLSQFMNTIQFFIAVKEDISERLQTEETLKVALAKYRTLFDSFPLGITVTDSNGAIIETNPIAEKLLGVPTQEQLERNLDSAEWQIVRLDETPMPPEEYASYRALHESKLVENVEMGIVKPRGEITWISVTAAPLPLEDYGVVITYGDITQRIQGDRALKRSEIMFRSVVKNSYDGIALINENGRIIEWNPALEKITSIPAAEACGRFIWDVQITLMHPDMRGPHNLERIKELALKVLESGNTSPQNQVYEWPYFRPDGQERVAEHAVFSIQTESGNILASNIRDISERKRSEKLAQLRMDLLEHAFSHSLDEWFQYALAEIGQIIQSTIGFFHDIDPDQKTVLLNTWSNSCLQFSNQINAPGARIRLDAQTGWAEAVRKRKVVNDTRPSRMLSLETWPEVDILIERQLLAPVVRSGKVIALFGVANKAIDYDAIDAHNISFIADTLWEIAQRKKIEQTLRSNEIRLRTLLEASPDGIAMIDMDDRIEYCNQRAAEIFGYPGVDEVINSGRNLYEFFKPEYHHILLEIGPRLSEFTNPQVIEAILVRKDGSSFPAEITWSLLHDQQGNPQSYVSVIRDITMRRQAEEALREYALEQDLLFSVTSAAAVHLNEQDLLPSVLDVLSEKLKPEIAWIYVEGAPASLTSSKPLNPNSQNIITERMAACQPDISNVVEFNNPNLRALLEEPFVQDDPNLVCLRSDQETNSICLNLSTKERYLGRLTLIWKDSSGLPKHPSRVFKALGQQIAIALHNVELYRLARQVNRITTLNQISASLTASLEPEQVLQQALENLCLATGARGASILRLIPETGEIVFEATLEHEASYLIGKKLPPGAGIAGWVVQHNQSVRISDVHQDNRYYDGFEAISNQPVQSLICAPMVNSGEVTGVIQLINKEQGEFSADDLALLEAAASYTAVAIANARLFNVVRQRSEEIAQLYEDLKHVMVEREQAQNLLIQSEKISALGRLAASVAHEINNPLQAVKGCLSLIDEEMEGDRDQQKLEQYIGIVNSEIDRVVTLVRGMREFSRPSRLQVQPTNIHEVLEDVLTLSAKQLRTGQIEVRKRFTSHPAILTVNSDHMKQIFMNMILNASDAMQKTSGQLHISTNLVASLNPQTPSTFVVQFHDSGHGMSPEVLGNLFQPFFTTKEGGSGLGLYVSQGIIESYGGKISVASQVNEGTTFTILLPVLQEATT